MRWRLPHIVIGAVCVGCAFANAARVPALPVMLAAGVVGMVALVLAGERARFGAVALAVALGAWPGEACA